MQYIDERVLFDFYDIIGSWDEGIYRYDIILDNEVIFVGNIYVVSTTPPKIDVTDILRNYYNGSYDFSWVLEDAKIIREVSVILYNSDQTDELTMTDRICFIYRQPNYNSLVTTPIIDIATEGIGSMLMLQGWDYFQNKGMLIPTYPKVDSENFAVDIVWARQTSDLNHQCDMIYSNGVIAKDVLGSDFSGGGIMKFGCPLDVIVRDYSETVVGPMSVRGFISSMDLNWNVGYIDDNGVDVLKANCTIGAAPYQAANRINIGFEGISGNYMLNNILDVEKTYSIKVDESSAIRNSSYMRITPYYAGGSIAGTPIKININEIVRDDILSRGNFTFRVTAKSNSSTYNVEVTIKVETNQTYQATICDTERLDVTTTSLDDPSEQYTYTALKFDGQSRYFLKWMDRYGMPQCQPFKCNHTYSEDITKSTITNYQNIKKITDVSVNSKWKLNSDWISEKFYQFYESIFVSPWLQLYDAKEDKVYSVILTNTEYTEKTFNNQNRSLFNLQLDVELDSTQTIIY